jgi:hypothetical protein
VRSSLGGDASALPALGSELAPDSELSLSPGTTLELTLDDYAAIRVLGPAFVRLLPDGEPALIVREGLVTVDSAPRAARSTSSAFWLATPAVRLDVVQGARFVVRARAARASELAVISGHVELRSHEASVLLVGAGELRCLGEGMLAPTRAGPPLLHLERAELALQARSSCSAKPVSLGHAEPLENALALLGQNRAEEQALLAEHGKLVAAHAPEAQALPAKLATLAAGGLQQLQRARALRASFEAAQLSLPPGEQATRLRELARTLAPY